MAIHERIPGYDDDKVKNPEAAWEAKQKGVEFIDEPDVEPEAVKLVTGLRRVRLHDRLELGGALLDVPDVIPSVWGEGRKVVWASGQGFIPFGPTGVGKTTLIQHVLAAGMRVKGLDTKVLDVEVPEFTKPWIYVAADRPDQVKRAFARLLGSQAREFLNERLIIVKGSPGYHLSNPKHVEYAAEDAVDLGAGGIVFDSLKDVSGGLVSDEAGQAIGQSMNALVREGVEVALLHHARKGERRPTSIDEMYGSALIPASAGTVISLWGTAGEFVMDVRQLKFADEEGIGPFTGLIDPRSGTVSIAPESQLGDWMRARGLFELKDAARYLSNDPGRKPTGGEIESARRRVNKHLDPESREQPKLVKVENGDKRATVYRVVEPSTGGGDE